MDRATDYWQRACWLAEAQRNALAARLAAAEKVIEVAEQWRNEIIRGATAVTFNEINLEAALENKLIAALDAHLEEK